MNSLYSWAEPDLSTGPMVFLVVFRRGGCSQMHPGAMGYSDAKRLVKKRYPRTGIIYTACRIFEGA